MYATYQWTTQVKYFMCGGEELIAFVADKIETAMHCINDKVFRPNDRADSLYIVVLGSVFVQFNILGPGESFGNRVFQATADGTTLRNHTATCLSNTVLYR